MTARLRLLFSFAVAVGLGLGPTTGIVRAAATSSSSGQAPPYEIDVILDGGQRGVTLSSLVVARWDAPRKTWVTVSEPGGKPLH